MPQRSRASRAIKVLAVSSGGGHWVQLRRVIPAFDGHDVVYVTVNEAYREDVPHEKVYIVNDATRWDRWGTVKLALHILWILLKQRPDVVFTTGAAPGFFALLFGRLLGLRTIWLDSIANIEAMSMSGRMARKYAGLWLTQWPGLAEEPGGPEFAGTVL